MAHRCPFCPGRTFKTASGLQSHQTQKKCHLANSRNILPSNPFLKYFNFKQKPAPAYPVIKEPSAEVVPRPKKRRKKQRFREADLKIPDDLLPADADTKSPEYREKIRSHFDSLTAIYPTLTCADDARANKTTLGMMERNFQKWCTKSKRQKDREKIRAKIEADATPVSSSRRGYKDVNSGQKRVSCRN